MKKNLLFFGLAVLGLTLAGCGGLFNDDPDIEGLYLQGGTDTTATISQGDSVVIVINGSDDDGDQVTYTFTASPAQGTFSPTSVTDANETRTVTYTAPADYTGSVTITVNAVDSYGEPSDDSDIYSIVLTIEAADFTEVASPATYAGILSTAMDASDGTLYAAFTDSNENLTVKKLDGSWTTVGSADFTTANDGTYGAIDLYAVSGKAYLAHVDSDSVFKVQEFNGTSWSVIGAEGDTGFTADGPSAFVQVAADSTGNVYTACSKIGDNAVTIYKYDGSAWSTEVSWASADLDSNLYFSPFDLEFDEAGGLSVAFEGDSGYADNDQQIFVFNRAAGATAWTQVGTALSIGDVETYNNSAFGLAVDEAGTGFMVAWNEYGTVSAYEYGGTAWTALGTPAEGYGFGNHMGVSYFDGDPVLSYETANDQSQSFLYADAAWTALGGTVDSGQNYVNSHVWETTLYRTSADDGSDVVVEKFLD